jgi:hypothetical protein
VSAGLRRCSDMSSRLVSTVDMEEKLERREWGAVVTS